MIQINCSDLAKFTGHNPYCSDEESTRAFWQSNRCLALKLGRKPEENIGIVEEALKMCDTQQLEDLRFNLKIDSAASCKDISREIGRAIVTPAVVQTSNSLVSDVMQEKCDRAVKGSAESLTRVRDAIAQQTQMKRGTVLEKNSLDELEKQSGKRVMHRNSKCLRSTLFRVNDMEVVLVGKVDGRFEETGEIIEAKERRKRLFERVVEYEKVQIHSYMHLTKTLSGVLRERYDSKTMDHTVQFDESFWADVIDKLSAFIHKELAVYLPPSPPLSPPDAASMPHSDVAMPRRSKRLRQKGNLP